MMTQNLKRRLAKWAAGVALFLLIPLALTIRDGNVEGVGWNWSPGDFVWAFVVLFGSGATYEVVSRRMSNKVYKCAVGLGVVSALVLIWINGAVGIIGDGPVNMMYVTVPLVGMIGGLIARLRPAGMARTLFAMAIAQMLIPVIALVVWNPPFSPGIVPVFFLNGVFALLFCGSALLFRRASAADLKLKAGA